MITAHSVFPVNSNCRKVVLVTGASSGLGREIACTLSRKGYRLVLMGRNDEQLAKSQGQCEAQNEHIILPIDLNMIELVFDTVQEILLEHQLEVYGFVHCAGITRVMATRVMQPAIFQPLFDVNFFSGMEILKAILQSDQLLENLRRVIFLSSTASMLGETGASIYCASKGAVEALVRGLSVELAPKVRVCAIAPGLVRTEMTQPYLDNAQTAAALASKFPLGIGETRDVSNVVSYLMGSKGDWMTGSTFVTDGGRLAL